MDESIKISVITSLYRGEKYLKGFFKSFLSISNLKETELVLVHNDKLDSETKLINTFLERIPNIKIIQVPREGVYRSWNRGIKRATGKYIAMWSVDDRRTKFSLAEQATVLDQNGGCSVVSGDYYKVLKYGDYSGLLKRDPIRINKLSNTLKFNNGCFLMWKKELHNKIGYFDEQFKVGGDWEFWMRVTSKYCVGRSESILGYYLRESNTGLSKSRNFDKDLENAIVKIRYYRFFAINVYKYIWSLKTKNGFNVKKIKNFDSFISLDESKSFPWFFFSLSFILFWIPKFKRSLVEVKYKLIS